MRQSFAWLVIAVCVLGIFYPSIFAEALSMDDQRMLQGLLNTQGLDLGELFWPSSSAYYYRPLLILSFYGDEILFGSQEAISHLINICIHLANTLLLYRLLRLMVPSGESEWPLLAALFFGIHPLVTEPVNWISGRTDLLAGFFVLLSAVVFVSNRGKTIGRDGLAACWYLCGLWSKEVAIGLLPVVCFVAVQEQGFALVRRWRAVAWRVGPFVAATLLYALMRTGGRMVQDIGIKTAVHGGHGAEYFSAIDKLFSLVKAIGFYAQKIIWPLPLNFAIVEINRPVALAVGCAAIVGLIVVVILCRRRAFLLGLVWIPCFLAPALPVAINRVAWTPLAERYLYLPLMGLSLLLVMALARMPRRTAAAGVMAAILFAWGIVTTERNIVWQTNLGLWQDVVEKSPNFSPGHNDYGIALMRAGKTEEGRWHLDRAASLVAGKGENLLLENRMQLSSALREATFEQKITQMEEVVASTPKTVSRAPGLQSMIELIDNALLRETFDQEQRTAWIRKLLACRQQLAELDSKPHNLYRIGQLHLALGEKAAAQAAFAKVCQSSNDYFTQPACTLAKRLAQETAGHPDTN